MAKPRFTVDPPPVGGSREDLLDWSKRQYDRIHDWWPKDLEDRLKALEIAFPYKSGTWPIVDTSSIQFNGIVPQFSLSCATSSTTYNTGEDRGLVRPTALTIHGDKLLVSRLGNQSGAAGSNEAKGILGQWDVTNQTWTPRIASEGINGADTVWHRGISAPGTVGQNDHVFVYSEYFNFAVGLRASIYVYRVSDWTQLTALSGIGNVFGADDSPNRVSIFFTGGNFQTRQKTDLVNGINNWTAPSGWTIHMPFWSTASNQWMVLCRNTSSGNFGWSMNAEGVSGTLATPSSTISELDGEGWAFGRPFWRDGNRDIYLYGSSTTYRNSLTPTPPDNQFILRFNDSGVLQRIYSYFDLANTSASVVQGSSYGDSVSSSNESNMYYHAPSNASYGTAGQVMIKHDIETDTWSKCTLTGLSSDSFYGRVGADNTAWHLYWTTEPTEIRILNSEIF